MEELRARRYEGTAWGAAWRLFLRLANGLVRQAPQRQERGLLKRDVVAHQLSMRAVHRDERVNAASR